MKVYEIADEQSWSWTCSAANPGSLLIWGVLTLSSVGTGLVCVIFSRCLGKWHVVFVSLQEVEGDSREFPVRDRLRFSCQIADPSASEQDCCSNCEGRPLMRSLQHPWQWRGPHLVRWEHWGNSCRVERLYAVRMNMALANIRANRYFFVSRRWRAISSHSGAFWLQHLSYNARPQCYTHPATYGQR